MSGCSASGVEAEVQRMVKALVDEKGGFVAAGKEMRVSHSVAQQVATGKTRAGDKVLRHFELELRTVAVPVKGGGHE
ncbi:hypothetical protein [Rhizobium sp. BE258]|uniref:hypothetical protein n=1 Tax=Rhizobium sp. BE258 TaxID=2817722 RepID=UPI0028588406|nr:hypothetical protein [Rhizobium sp. BE258]MDR7145173.1 hypothetical protein [Rhizobium sp. BE258]